jgi:hypothetical protein
MWINPMLELRMFELCPYRSSITERYGLRQYEAPPAESIPLREWLQLLVEMWIAFRVWLRERKSLSQPEQPCQSVLSLRDIRAMPLHQVEDKTTAFSLN